MSDELQFDVAEIAGPPGCTACKGSLGGEYFQVNGSTVCAACAEGIQKVLAGSGTKLGRFTKAVLFGLGGALVGAGIYYAVSALTGYEVGLISILVGIIVGKCVRAGSGGRGGLKYQELAAALTYLAIVSTYLPLFVKEFSNVQQEEEAATQAEPGGSPEAAVPPVEATNVEKRAEEEIRETETAEPGPFAMLIGLVVLAGYILAAPFLAGFENILGLLIIGFGVWQAWKINARAKLDITGPHAMSPPSIPGIS